MKEVTFNFEKLKIYQKALSFVDFVYKIARSFPKDEKYGLSAQYKRAAISIALNISEGHGDTNLQFNRYLNIARNSIKECVTCSSIARRQNFISNDVDEQSRIKLEELAKMISGLKRKLKE